MEDAWGNEVYKHPHVRSMYEGWKAALEAKPDHTELLREAVTAVQRAYDRNKDAMDQAKQLGAPSYILEIGANEARVYSSFITKANAALGRG